MTTQTTTTSVLSGKKKLIAYILGNVMLVIFAFVLKPDPKMVLSVLAIINGGYWGAESGVDIARAIFQAIAAKNGKE